MTPLFCVLILAGIIARLARYESKPLDFGMKIGMIGIGVQICRIAAAAL